MLKEPVRERTERELEKSGRITPRMVLEAYEEAGCRVGFDHYYSDGAACALGALMIAGGFTLSEVCDLDGVEAWIDLTMGRAGPYYSSGFVRGLDGKASLAGGPLDLSEARGFRDGQRARRFVLARLSSRHPDAG